MSVDRLTKYALLTALTVVLSMFFIIPIPGTKGFITLCEVGIYTAAQLFGGGAGLIVGGLSGGLIDILSGYPEWMIFSIMIHGAQGFVAGKLAAAKHLYLGLALASLIMIVGYFFAGWFLFSWSAAIPSLPTNLIQNILGIILSTPVVAILKRTLKGKKDF